METDLLLEIWLKLTVEVKVGDFEKRVTGGGFDFLPKIYKYLLRKNIIDMNGYPIRKKEKLRVYHEV